MDTQHLKGLRVAIYARYSSDNQREASIDDQVRVCRQHVERMGGTVDPNLVFMDHAISGASLNRPAFEKLMQLVTAKPRAVDAIVTEDVSRVTRSLADGMPLLAQLKYLGVPLIGVSDGIDTSARSAKVNFTIKNLLADMYLEDLRDKTLRGLEGRALAGYSTGGLPLGYRSEDARAADGQTIGHTIVIDAAQAEVVRRVFREYLAGRSLTGIAATFNREGVAPPRAHTQHRRKGWVASTIRAILHNAAYVGEWSFKRREWRKVPGTNKRRPHLRHAADVQHFARPHLRIIDADTWARAQERLESVRAHYTRGVDGAPKGRSVAGRATPYLLSGLLVCDVCGAPMVIAGGSSARYYRCGDYHKRRTCTNTLSVREEVARRRVLDALRERLGGAEGLAYVRRRIAEGLGEIQRGATADLAERRGRLARTEERIKGLVTFIADGDRSEYVVTTLRDLEAQARTEKAAIAELESRADSPIKLPTPDEVLQRVFDFEARLKDDVLAGREALRELLRDGQIRLRPDPSGVFIARSAILPLRLLLAPETTKPAEDDVQGRLGILRLVAGGRYSALYTEISVPFEVRLAS